MKIAVYLRKEDILETGDYKSMISSLASAGHEVFRVFSGEDLEGGADLVLAVGGDGTFLSAARVVSDSNIPVMGVNMGRLGFLSGIRPEDVAEAVSGAPLITEDRSLLSISGEGFDAGECCEGWPFALNEIAVSRKGSSMLGIDVEIDGAQLPTYWADGIIISTASGSTAYSLSVGGPIVNPSAKVLIVSPIASHNLNVRPLVVPDTSRIRISFRSREDRVTLMADNRTGIVPSSSVISVSLAHFSLKRVRPRRESFIDALTSKLYWGEDRRNNGR
ncbi:MAG: NAD(+)/NADH kinase [Bacteroidales bacterium]|nr:NAD(+)/NADH kinase [Bacteroidales bacterium]